MVHLKILTGKQAGASKEVRRFPVRIGRAPGSDIRLEEDGVWDHHLVLGLSPGAGFVLETQPGVLATANGQPVQRAVLRNGDTIQVGSVKMQFWLAEARQRGLRLSEALVWGLVFIVTVAQAVLISWLIRGDFGRP